MMLKHILDDTMQLKKDILTNKNMKWIKACELYMEQLSIDWEALEEMDRSEVRRRCREMNDEEWRGRKA